MSEDTPVIILFKSAHPALYTAHRRYPGSQLGPGFLTAHRGTHLVLLHSCPDTVHEVLLRKTQTSTPLTRGSPASSHPRRDITSAGADCRYRAPLSPRLRGSFMTCSCGTCVCCCSHAAQTVSFPRKCLFSILQKHSFCQGLHLLQYFLFFRNAGNAALSHGRKACCSTCKPSDAEKFVLIQFFRFLPDL